MSAIERAYPHHQQQPRTSRGAGHLVRIRRGLYSAVLRGIPRRPWPSTDTPPVATAFAPDAVVAFHAALQFHGKAHSATQVCTLDIRELAAEKFAALLARTAGWDLFDTQDSD